MIDMSTIEKFRVYCIAEKRAPAGTLCSYLPEHAILADFAQIITDFGHIKEVLTQDFAPIQQDRNTFVIEGNSGSVSTSRIDAPSALL